MDLDAYQKEHYPLTLYREPNVDYHQLHTSMTPLMIARRCHATEVVQYLERISRPSKRLSLEERADAAGVPHDRLKVIPQALSDAARKGKGEESTAAKRAIQKIQIANQQIVARAEKKLKASSA